MEQSKAYGDVHLTFNFKICTNWTRNLGVRFWQILVKLRLRKAQQIMIFGKQKNSSYSWRRSIPQSAWSSVASRSCSSACTAPSSWQCQSDGGENNGEMNKDIKEHNCHLHCLPSSSLSHWAVGEKGNPKKEKEIMTNLASLYSSINIAEWSGLSIGSWQPALFHPFHWSCFAWCVVGWLIISSFLYSLNVAVVEMNIFTDENVAL